MTEVEAIHEQQRWDDCVEGLAGHPLQLWGWGEVKAAHGWKADRVLVRRGDEVIGAVQLLIRRLPRPFRAMVYVPRGPACAAADREAVLQVLAEYVRQHHPATVLTIEPDWPEVATPEGWRRSPNTILIPRTLQLDLTRSEDELLADIARKRRYDIRVSTTKVHRISEVREMGEREKVLQLYHQTAQRAGFALHGDDYYRDIARLMDKHSVIIAAWGDKGEALAFTWFAQSTQTAFELYSGISKEGQQLRANYALKWWCIQEMKRRDVRVYDFNGLLNDGISDFKRSFASHETQLAGTFDMPLSPLYPLWVYGLPAGKRVVRTMRRALR